MGRVAVLVLSIEWWNEEKRVCLAGTNDTEVSVKDKTGQDKKRSRQTREAQVHRLALSN